MQTMLIDEKTGNVFDGRLFEIGIEYHSSSSLFVIDPRHDVEEAFPGLEDVSSWIKTTYYRWEGKELLGICEISYLEYS